MKLENRDVRTINSIFKNMLFEPEIPDDKSLESFDPEWEPNLPSRRNWMGKLRPIDP